MGVGIVFIVALTLFLGFLVFQARFAARHWRRVIAAGDPDALAEALDAAFEGWRAMRPPRGTAAADWQALQSAALVAADRDRCRVSLLATPDVRVVEHERQAVGDERDVARRAAVAMAERLLYEIPHVRFGEVQIDLYAEHRDAAGGARHECLLSTRVSRNEGAQADWDSAQPGAILAGWRTRESAPGQPLDPDAGALIDTEEPGVVLSMEPMEPMDPVDPVAPEQAS